MFTESSLVGRRIFICCVRFLENNPQEGRFGGVSLCFFRSALFGLTAQVVCCSRLHRQTRFCGPLSPHISLGLKLLSIVYRVVILFPLSRSLRAWQFANAQKWLCSRTRISKSMKIYGRRAINRDAKLVFI